MVVGNRVKIRGVSWNITRLLRIPSMKKEYLYAFVACGILFSLFFLLGSTGNSNGTVPPPTTKPTATRVQECLRDRLNSKPLDFRSSHEAESALTSHAPNAYAAREFHAPPCAANMSEYTPCQDVKRSLRFERDRLVYRERHCPEGGSGEAVRCRVPAPDGYRVPMRWPESREWAWYANVPHKELTVEKKVQNWVHYESGRFRFPGGGTMFPNGADAYIDEIGELIDLSAGGIRTAVDTGCGVASWGGYLLSREILTMSFAPRDTHEAQVQFALERGIPAMIGILASMRLPYPSRAFDMAHCSRCLIPWAQYDGVYLIEVDRILRPGGYWILSGPPINWEKHWKGWERSKEELSDEQTAIENVARSLCWKLIKKHGDLAIWQKPTNHIHCRETPKFCHNQDPDTAWYTKMEECVSPLPEVREVAKWPQRLNSVPPRIAAGTVVGVTEETFLADTAVWKKRVEHYKRVDGQLAERGRYRNLLDMNAYLGGFAAALVNHHSPVWVMNVHPAHAPPNILGVVFERGLIGTYHNWCEAMSTYPRTYDFIHAHSIFTLYSIEMCEVGDILLEMDRILRPEGSMIVRDDVDEVVKVKKMLEAMQYVTRVVDHEDGPMERQKILLAKKQYWTASSSNHTQTNNVTS